MDESKDFDATQSAGPLKNYRDIGMDDKNKSCYYRAVILGCVRCIDYLFTRDDFNMLSAIVGPCFSSERLLTRSRSQAAVGRSAKLLILEWFSHGHDGGDLAFGPDGYLSISSGDGSLDSDANNTGQDLRSLASGILRIDVDRTDAGKPYAIPADNPFRKMAGARPEKGAQGLRNPWRMCFEDALLIAPGDPERSLIYHRVAKPGRGRMPPLSTRAVDEQAVRLLAAWIRQIRPKEPPKGTP